MKTTFQKYTYYKSFAYLRLWLKYTARKSSYLRWEVIFSNINCSSFSESFNNFLRDWQEISNRNECTRWWSILISSHSSLSSTRISASDPRWKKQNKCNSFRNCDLNVTFFKGTCFRKSRKIRPVNRRIKELNQRNYALIFLLKYLSGPLRKLLQPPLQC